MLKTYFEKYLTLNLRDYPNIAADLPINMVLLLAALALSVAFVALSIKRRNARALIGQLIRHGAVGESQAKTLGELGLIGVRGVRRELLGGGFINSLVGRVGGKNYTYEEYIELEKEKKLPKTLVDFDAVRFFIPEEKSAEAKEAYDRFECSAFRMAVYCVLIFALFVCISLAMPSLLSFIDSVFEA